MKKTILFLVCYLVVLFPARTVSGATFSAAIGSGLPLVGYALVEEKDSVLTKHYLGAVEAINHVDVLSRTNGFVKSINFADGQMVEAGRILMELDASVHESALERARAGVKSAEATLELKKVLNDRAQRLVTTSAVSRNEADTAFADYSVAAAALQQANAALHLAELELGFTKIMAPISGRAGLSRVSVGSYVHSGSGPLVDITQLDPIRVVIPVREADFIAASSGGTESGFDLLGGDFAPRLVLADGRVYPERGSLDAIASSVDPMTGTVDVRARFPNKDLLLLPGGVVDVTLDSQTPSLQAAVPAAALQQDKNGYFVLLINDANTVEKREIELGQQIGRYFMVRQGVKAGDKVVVDGIQRIRPGVEVNPVPRELPAE